MTDYPDAVVAADAPPRNKPSNYPEPFASMMAGRIKRPLGDLFGSPISASTSPACRPEP
jgi:hypothetical protein